MEFSISLGQRASVDPPGDRFEGTLGHGCVHGQRGVLEHLLPSGVATILRAVSVLWRADEFSDRTGSGGRRLDKSIWNLQLCENSHVEVTPFL